MKFSPSSQLLETGIDFVKFEYCPNYQKTFFLDKEMNLNCFDLATKQVINITKASSKLFKIDSTLNTIFYFKEKSKLSTIKCKTASKSNTSYDLGKNTADKVASFISVKKLDRIFMLFKNGLVNVYCTSTGQFLKATTLNHNSDQVFVELDYTEALGEHYLVVSSYVPFQLGQHPDTSKTSLVEIILVGIDSNVFYKLNELDTYKENLNISIKEAKGLK